MKVSVINSQSMQRTNGGMLDVCRLDKVATYCPHCNSRERTYKRVIYIPTGEHLPDEYGRCNRENNCGYSRFPSGQELRKWEQEHGSTSAASSHDAPPPPPPVVVHLDEVYSKYRLRQRSDALFMFLCKYWPADEVAAVLDRYGCTSSARGGTLFWYQDRAHVHTAKMMHYGTNGHRIKTSHPDWMHSYLMRSGSGPFATLKDDEKARYKAQIDPYGLHLLSDEVKCVFVVESEKTALICALQYQFQKQWLFVSVGGSENVAKIDQIRQHCKYHNATVVLLPDNDKAGGKWLEYGKKHGVKVNTEVTSKGGVSADIADVIIEERQLMLDASTYSYVGYDAPAPPAPQQETVSVDLNNAKTTWDPLAVGPFLVEHGEAYGLPY